MRKLLFPLGLISLFLLLFFSCRRTEVIAETSKNLQHERFFNVSNSASPQAKAIAAAIKKQDAKYHFVSEVIKKAGYPVWDKVRIVNYKNQTTTGRSASDSVEEVVYVPFVLDSQKRTNAVLSVAIAPADSIYRMLYAANYRKLGYDTTDNTKWNAQSAFGLFTSFDYTVFGHKKFFIKDSLLFKTPKDSIRLVATIVQHNGQDVNRTANQWDCLWMNMCPVKSSGGDEHQSVRTATDCPGGFQLTLCLPLGTGGASGLSGAWIGTSNGTGPVANPTGDPNMSGGGWWYGDNTSPCKPTGGQSTRVDNVPSDICGSGWTVVTSYPPTVVYLASILNLTSPQIDWLASYISVSDEIHQALQEDLNQNPIANNSYPLNPTDEAKIAANITVTAAMNNLINGALNSHHYDQIKVYIPNSHNYPNVNPIFWALFKVQCALIRADHPEYSDLRVYWEATKELLHIGLDVIGLVPAIGEIADLANGFIYTIEGDGVNATLSYASTIPMAGWYAAGIKFAKRTISLAGNTKTTLKWLKRADGGIDFGDRNQLRTVLGLAKGDSRIAHHVIPWTLRNHPVVQMAAKDANPFHLNELLNGIPLSSTIHTGGHAIYISKIENRLNAMRTFNPNMSTQDAKTLLTNLINDVKTAIQNNPNTHIDQISF